MASKHYKGAVDARGQITANIDDVNGKVGTGGGVYVQPEALANGSHRVAVKKAIHPKMPSAYNVFNEPEIKSPSH